MRVVSLLVLFVIYSGCQNQTSSKVTIQLPENKSNKYEVLSVGQWGLSDPSEVGQMKCYAVAFGSANSQKTCESVDYSKFAADQIYGPFLAGQKISIETKSGFNKSIRLIGINASSAEKCMSYSANPSDLSAPFALGSYQGPVIGNQEVQIEVSVNAAKKIQTCSSENSFWLGSYPCSISNIFSGGAGFVALGSDSSAIPWGVLVSHEDMGAQLASGVTQVVINSSAYAALKSDGSVVTWGQALRGGTPIIYDGPDKTSVDISSHLTSGVIKLYNTNSTFAALKSDGTVISWGYDSTDSLDSRSVSGIDTSKEIVSTGGGSYAAIKVDGSVVTWGSTSYGGDSSAVASHLDGTNTVTNLISNTWGFAATLSNNDVVIWGTGASTPSHNPSGQTIVNIRAMTGAFAVLYSDESIAHWGNTGGASVPGTIPTGSSELFSNKYSFLVKGSSDIIGWGVSENGADVPASMTTDASSVDKIFSTSRAYAVLKHDDTVVTWGNTEEGGDSSAVSDQLINVTAIYSTDKAFAALKSDGSVVTWGDSDYGGDSSDVAAQLNGTIPVTQIYSNTRSFAALRSDGSVITWGDTYRGGDSSAVSTRLCR